MYDKIHYKLKKKIVNRLFRIQKKKKEKKGSLQKVTAATKLKAACSLEEELSQNYTAY